MNLRRRSERAFTFIELMTVCLILGTLMSILVPRVIRGRFKAAQNGCLQSERNVATALESYSVDNDGTYPDTLPGLLSTSAGKSYIQSIPSCPSAPGSSYNTTYEIATDHRSYTISCPGAHYLQLPEITQGFPQYISTGELKQYNSNN